MSKDDNLKNNIATLLTEDCSFTGTLKFNRMIQFDGKLKGQIEAPEGSISIGQKGEIEAEILVDKIYNKGSVKGELKAMDVVHIHSGATFEGSLTTKELIIEKGGKLNGLCSMIKEEKKEEDTVE